MEKRAPLDVIVQSNGLLFVILSAAKNLSLHGAEILHSAALRSE
jgi:hypothetical protein